MKTSQEELRPRRTSAVAHSPAHEDAGAGEMILQPQTIEMRNFNIADREVDAAPVLVNNPARTRKCTSLRGLKASELKGWKKVIYKIILLAPIAIMSAVLMVAMTPVAGIFGAAIGAALGTFIGSIISTGIENIIRKHIFKEEINSNELWKSNMTTAAKCTIAAFAGGLVGGAITGALTTAFTNSTIVIAAGTQTFANFVAVGAGASLTATASMITLRGIVGGALKAAKNIPNEKIPSAFAVEGKDFVDDVKTGFLIGGAAESLSALSTTSAPFAAIGLMTLGNTVGESIATLVKVAKRHEARKRALEASQNGGIELRPMRPRQNTLVDQVLVADPAARAITPNLRPATPTPALPSAHTSPNGSGRSSPEFDYELLLTPKPATLDFDTMLLKTYEDAQDKETALLFSYDTTVENAQAAVNKLTAIRKNLDIAHLKEREATKKVAQANALHKSAPTRQTISNALKQSFNLDSCRKNSHALVSAAEEARKGKNRAMVTMHAAKAEYEQNLGNINGLKALITMEGKSENLIPHRELISVAEQFKFDTLTSTSGASPRDAIQKERGASLADAVAPTHLFDVRKTSGIYSLPSDEGTSPSSDFRAKGSPASIFDVGALTISPLSNKYSSGRFSPLLFSSQRPQTRTDSLIIPDTALNTMHNDDLLEAENYTMEID